MDSLLNYYTNHIKYIILNNSKLNYDFNLTDVTFILNDLHIFYNSNIEFNSDLHTINSLFDSQHISHISINKFIYSILKYSKCPIEYLYISFIYLIRLLNTKKIILTNYNIHYFLLISIILTIYYLDDDHYSLRLYIKYSKIPTLQKINSMIFTYLSLINWNLYI